MAQYLCTLGPSVVFDECLIKIAALHILGQVLQFLRSLFELTGVRRQTSLNLLRAGRFVPVTIFWQYDKRFAVSILGARLARVIVQKKVVARGAAICTETARRHYLPNGTVLDTHDDFDVLHNCPNERNGQRVIPRRNKAPNTREACFSFLDWLDD